MINCAHCTTLLAIDAAFCPECGTATNISSAINTEEMGYNSANKFTSFIAPALDDMDKGNFLIKPMQWFFIANAFLSLILPLAVVIKLKKDDVFADASIFAIIISLFSIFMGWIGFQIWWNRKNTLQEKIHKQDEFKAIPLFSYNLQTSGEWYGAYVTIMGVGSAIATFFLAKDRVGYYNLKSYFIILPPGADPSSYWMIIYSVIAGFFILIIFRFIAEFIRAIAAIANNTAKNNLN